MRILIEGAFLSPFGFETIVNSWICLEKGDEKSKNEILKLKELPNERLEGSWGALWLGIRTFFGFKLGDVGLQGELGGAKKRKSWKSTRF